MRGYFLFGDGSAWGICGSVDERYLWKGYDSGRGGMGKVLCRVEGKFAWRYILEEEGEREAWEGEKCRETSV